MNVYNRGCMDASFGKPAISRYGDLISPVYVDVKLPSISIRNPQTLFELCSLAITNDELNYIPESIREDCEHNRRIFDLPIPIKWTKTL